MWRQQGPHIQIHFLHEKVKQNIINIVEENALENVKCTIPYLRFTLGIVALFSWYFHSFVYLFPLSCKLMPRKTSMQIVSQFQELQIKPAFSVSYKTAPNYLKPSSLFRLYFSIKTWNSSLFFCHFISSMSTMNSFSSKHRWNKHHILTLGTWN